MKLIVQIPCLNEAETLPATVRAIPRTIPGVDRVEILVVDDGSTDGTSEVARQLGVDHLVRLTQHRGLAYAFATGLDACLRLGADIIVNTDADNQYRGQDVEKLIRPILAGEAEIVVGVRPIDTTPHFSSTKKWLQKLGSWVVRVASGTRLPDAISGFRAYTREAAMALNIFSDFTYTLETTIQAGKRHMAVSHVPIETNPPTRESRLITSIPAYVFRSAQAILRTYAMYEPLRIFTLLGLGLFSVGLVFVLRFLYFFAMGQGQGHIQSLVLAGVLLAIGVQIMLMGIMADLVAINRHLEEEILLRLKRLEISTTEIPSNPANLSQGE